MLFGFEGEAFWGKLELGDIEQAEEAAFDGLGCVIGDFDSLVLLGVELDDLGGYSDMLFLHGSVKFRNKL